MPRVAMRRQITLSMDHEFIARMDSDRGGLSRGRYLEEETITGRFVRQMDRLAERIVVVFDGPPGPESGRFVEVEDCDGHAVVLEGGWRERDDGFWELGPFLDAG